ncbi:MAG: MBL fold metallo-hydrolase RNA specificity domain-containing protein, partial [Lapillicoccus sp.]
MRGTDGLVVVLASAQNIDRLVTVYRSALRAERDLVVDLYTADVAAATGRASIPRPGPDWPRVHVHVPLRQRVRVKDSGEFGRVARVREHRLYAEQLRSRRSGLVLFGAYQSEMPRLLREGLLEGGAVVWSMWDGYLHEASGLRLQAALRCANVPLVHHHTSGHASTEDLAQLVAALHPRVVVPIHTDAPDEYAAAIGPLVQARADGVWWPV